MHVAITTKAFRNDVFCGDQAGAWMANGKAVLCMVDGLGHGEEAEEAGVAAVEYVSKHLDDTFQEIFAGCNRAIGHTRGVAMGIALLSEETSEMLYAGIGNTRAMIFGPRRRKITHMSSDPGIIGGGYRNLVPETTELKHGDIIVMSTDGVEEMIDISIYDRDTTADPKLLSRKIIQDWGRERDDRGVLVYQTSRVPV